MREILYFESNKRKVFIVTEKGTFVAYAKLNDIEESLKQSKVPFLRVHQSYLVNYKHVEGQAYDFVVMDNSKKISISEDRRKLIGEQYCSMEDTIYVGE
ncbi:MAG: LytR/AlgR family response regulator transcription factor [Streptococcus sp.]